MRMNVRELRRKDEKCHRREDRNTVQTRALRRGLPSSLRPSPLISAPVWLLFASGSPSFPQPFTRICRYPQKSVYGNCYTMITDTYLKRILAREALVTVRAGERLHG